MRSTGILPFLLALLLAGCSAGSQPQSGPLILAAASLQEVLEEAADSWEAQGHPRPSLSFAASSALARQVEAGAPGDLFISADEQWMDAIEANGSLAAGTRATLAGNRLVLIAPAAEARSIALSPGFPLARELGEGRLAMADPDSVPAGRYGKEALSTLGLWEEVSGKLAVGENVRVALTLVSRGEAPLGIVYATDARADAKVQVVAIFPADSHSPITYPVARLAQSAHPDAAAFEDFLLSDEGQAIFRRFGFEPG
ncbi:molybdate ABC transporter substrate-binding protein [Alteraurantiacibacter aquimixticola]|uniref:Molybdate ABC transporter substrate-binding protein n=1 Tax=Alteraurantiacibacter aquimixticola TaxID=2489173 RepID=A0A4T3F4U6_9SPHN|nr:molybdate ABC transporter substrate-binding protein [Alteraurantiacibacter aquimixticola]TIX51489.1 molybdate ABC transporter substrate-binding protein [Alteraurantiacibacter aquimixticola]